MKLIEEFETTSAFEFCSGEEEEAVTKLIEKHGSDYDLITARLNAKYPEDKYFVLVDYIDDRNTGYFKVRVWEV